MTAWDVVVDGASLNTLGYRVDDLIGFRTMAPRDNASTQLVGGNGSIPATTHFSDLTYTISMWVDGVDPATGLVTTTPERHLHDNMTIVNRILSGNTAMSVAITDPNDYTWTSLNTVAGSSVPERAGLYAYRITFVMNVPAGMWSGVATTLSFTNFTTSQILTNLAIGNAPVCDAILQVKGPITNPVFQCGLGDGSIWSIGHTGALTSTQWWQVDASKWTSRIMAGAWTPGGADTRTVTSSNLGTITQSSANGSGYLIEIWPTRPTANYRVSCTGTATGTAIWHATTTPKRV